MNVEEGLEVADEVVFLKLGRRLNEVEIAILQGSWQGRNYEEIADTAGYSHSYLQRDVGPKLWRMLSVALGETVSKTNFRPALERLWRAQANKTVTHLGADGVDQTSVPLINYPSISLVTPSAASIQTRVDWGSLIPNSDLLEFPSGPVPLNSRFYLARPPIEERTYAQINKPGSLTRIKAPRQMGKTSLLHRIMLHARQAKFRTVLLSLQRADSSIFASLDKFLRWLCANVSQQLNLEPRLNDYWDEDIGSKVSCTLYFQKFLLEEIDSPIVLALDEVNRIFEYPEIYKDFLPLLRSWYEEASELDVWQKLRLVVVHATEAYIPLDINQSPFNVGLSIKLPEFSLEQVQSLAKLYKLDWANNDVGEQNLASLIAMVGGHPYLVRVALYHLGSEDVTLQQLLQEAPTISGIYSNHLRHQLTNLQNHPELLTALKRVVTVPKSMPLEAIAAYKLESMGLVKLQGNEAMPSCELYRLYFREQLG